jgi:hypothetical protein
MTARQPLPVASGFIIPAYDNVALTQASLTDTFVFSSTAESGQLTTVATVVITYTTSAKTVLSTVVKTPSVGYP